MCRGGSMALRRYGDLGDRTRADGGNAAHRLANDVDAMPGAAEAAPRRSLTCRAASHGIAAQDEGMSCRLWAMKSRRMD